MVPVQADATGFEPVTFPLWRGMFVCFRYRARIAERPAGVEPALPPWQGDRLPLHHGRLIGCRVVKDRRAPGGNRTLVTALRVRCLAAGPPVLIRCGQPIASLSLNGCPKPKIDVDKSAEVGPEGLEPSPAWVRTRDAAANTSIPFFFSVVLWLFVVVGLRSCAFVMTG